MSIYYHHNNITSILCSHQKTHSGRLWAHSESPGCCQRHGRVLGADCSGREQAPSGMGRGTRNPSIHNVIPVNIFFGACTYGTVPAFVSGAHRSRCGRSSPVSRSRYQCGLSPKDGGQPRCGGCGSGVCTIRSRHPRRQVLDPNQSMNLGGVSRKWGGDQNLTERCVVGKQKICDIFPRFNHSIPSGHPLRTQSHHREVAR